MKLLASSILFFSTFIFSFGLSAQTSESTYLYKATTIRAAPGMLQNVIDLLSAQIDAGFYEASGEPPPFMMRHSQGDQWDIFLLYPMGAFEDYYSRARIRDRERMAETTKQFEDRLNQMISFREDLYALGPDLETVSEKFTNNNFFHIEMFHAIAGKHDELLKQRTMENDYLERIGIPANLIWKGISGSDVDVFTIGFYTSIVDYATPAELSEEDYEQAARAAGFNSRNSIGFYLRELILSHHDTLAVSVN